MIGRIARVTGRVGPGLLGEVSLPWRGGTIACLAHPADAEQRVLEIGERVLVVDASPPRTVYVAPLGSGGAGAVRL